MAYMKEQRPAWVRELERGGKTKSEKKVEAAFHEVHHDTPAIVSHTAKKFGKADAERQRVAIALSKARKAGAKI